MTFVVFQLHTLFAITITLLIIAPIVMIATTISLSKKGKFYLFTGVVEQYSESTGTEEQISIKGWRGFFRYPVIFALSSAAPLALGYLLYLLNPLIAHSSEWAVWSSLVAGFIVIAWVGARGSDYLQPSALARAYGLLWLFIAWWLFLVADVIAETRLNIAGGYWAIFLFGGIFLSLVISYLEMSSLPSKHGQTDKATNTSRPQTRDGDDDDEPDERTRLLNNRQAARGAEEETDYSKAYYGEQGWAFNLPSWLWLFQFILTVPFTVILVSQLGLLLVSGLHQTGQDGSSMLILYMAMALITILLFSPIVPFLHRFTWHVPAFLVLILGGTLLYNIFAFPFSSQNRLKLYFQQQVDLETGNNTVVLNGMPPYVKQAVADLPSAHATGYSCVKTGPGARQSCSWAGTAPNVIDPLSDVPPESQYRDWLTLDIKTSSDPSWNGTRTAFPRLYDRKELSRLQAPFSRSRSKSNTTIRFSLSGLNTRACKLVFDHRISDFTVHGSSLPDPRFPIVPQRGSNEIRLWSRTWNRTWVVDVVRPTSISGNTTLSGKAVCLWSDDNQLGAIPALDEVRHYGPDWMAVTKAADGLVEGYKRFAV